jgi:RNA polymerase sigma factor (sigma-70 family)
MESATASAGHTGGISLLRLHSDERLARLAAAGKADAFEVLVRRYRAALIRAARRILPEDRAEDAVQQALLDAHRALARGDDPDRFRPWLHRIAVNAALKELRGDDDTVPLAEELNGVEGPAQTHERRERLRQTVEAIHALPGSQRRALVARELEGRSHAEIAQELGLSGGAVRQLIHRARNSVRSAVSVLIPPEFVLRLLGAGGSSPPVAETAAGAGGAGVAAKLAVAAVLAGGVAGGVAVEQRGDDRAQAPAPAESGESSDGGEASSAAGAVGLDSSGPGGSERSGSNSGPGGGGGDSSGPGSGSSGSGSSGSGSGSSGADSSGSGSSGSGISGSGSSGSGSSGSDSLSFDSSGSGSSGSGSTLSSGSDSSGSSGSGSSDSGSSGSG